MAQTFTSVAELAKINDVTIKDYGIDNLYHSAPLIEVLNAIPASNGTVHKYLRRTAAPTVGFRDIGQGLDRSFGTNEVVIVNLKYEDADYVCDVAEASAFARGGKEAYIARGVASMIGEALYKLEKQVFYGTDGTTGHGDANGYDGLSQALNALSNAMVVNGGGTTANGQSSVYMLRTGGDGDVAIVLGNDGEIDVLETSITQVQDGSTPPKTLSAYLTPIGQWSAVQVGGLKSAGRIANLDATHGLNDAKLAQLYAKFPANAKPTVLAMNSVAIGQLQASRTATSPTGAPAPFPTDYNGIPIIVTDVIVNTEAVVA